MALLKCENLVLGYDGKVVVQDLSFEVNSGDYLCVVGENGTGKSTLIKAILKLHSPLNGSLELQEGLKANQIGYLPQQTVIQKDFPASVEEIVLSGCLNHMGLRPFYSRKEKQLAVENMAKMGISELAKSCYRELSGGQQQRVLLARALCATSKLLLLDEPVSGLDPSVSVAMYSTIEKLNKAGVTIIMVSHDIAAAVKYATNILHIGKHCFFGTLNQYRESEYYRYLSGISHGGDE
ncbi:MAG: ABC transporter ATP-binding protein [Clostridia bacterium]|nr:ABC transporter ATP-binding protein [Clostridia bacterium]